MKLITTVLFLLCLPFGTRAGIVNNSGSTSADSISIPFFVLDSTGNMTTLEAGDSVSLVVFYPSGSVAYNQSVADNDTSISSSSNLGYVSYAMKAAVADIDGNGKDGLYSYMLVVKDKTSAALATPVIGQFQLYQATDFDFRLNEIGAVADTLESHDNWVARVDNQVSLSFDHTTLLNQTSEIKDTANAIIDSIQSGLLLASSSISDLVDATWDELQASHTTVGSFGRYLDVEISGVGSGTGAYSFRIIAFDSSRGQVVPGVSLAVRNIDQTALVGTGRTNSLGLATFNLDTDDYAVIATGPGYLFEPFDTVTISGTGVDTVKGYPFDPGNPVSPSLCRVWGNLYDVSGIPQAEVDVSASLPGGVSRQGSLVISPFQVKTSSDSAGYFYLDLIPSDSLTPVGSLYEITVIMPGGTALRKRLAVPATSSWQLTW